MECDEYRGPISEWCGADDVMRLFSGLLLCIYVASILPEATLSYYTHCYKESIVFKLQLKIKCSQRLVYW